MTIWKDNQHVLLHVSNKLGPLYFPREDPKNTVQVQISRKKKTTTSSPRNIASYKNCVVDQLTIYTGQCVCFQ
jgi:hypothetical protein